MKLIAFFILISLGFNLFAADDQGLWDPEEYHSTSGPQYEAVVGYLTDNKDRLNNSEVIVDLGCLCGRTTRYLAEQYPDATVVGIDPERKAIEFAENHSGGINNLQFICAAGQNYDLSKHNLNLANTIVCYHVLHWIDRDILPRVFDNITRNLASNGTVDIVTSAQQDTTDVVKAVRWTALTKWPLTALKSLPKLIRGQGNYTLLTKQELQNLAEQSGLVVDSCEEMATTTRFKSRDEFGEWLATIIKPHNLFDNDEDRHAFSRDTADVYCTDYSGEKEDGEIVYTFKSLHLEAHEPQ